MKNKISLILATLVILLGSCASQKKVPYMIDAETIPQEALDKIAANNEPRVMPGDLLEITVMSYNIDAVRPFNRSSFVTELNRTTSNYSNDTNRNTYYIVDDNGDIEFPVIGKLRIGGMNKSQIQELICNEIYPKYITEKTGVDVRFNVLQRALRQGQLAEHLVVPLKNLDGVPPLLLLGQAVDSGLLDMGQGVLHHAGEGVHGHGSAGFGGLNGGIRRRLHAVAFQGGNLHHRAAQRLGKLFRIDSVLVFPDHIHHVDGHHHGDAQLGELGGQVQIAFQVRAVHDVQDGVRPLADQVIPGHHFLQGVGGQGINAGQVGDGYISLLFQLALFFLHGDTGPVAHILVGAGQGVEQRGLAAVGVARQGNSQFHSEFLAFR